MLGSRKFHCRIGRTARALALLAALGIGGTGCRFGNQVILAKDPAALSGFYKTEAESMSICAKLTGQDWRCANADTSMIPSTIQNILTDPVYVSANSVKSKAYLVPNSLDTSSFFEMSLDSEGALSADPALGESTPLWTDDACLSQLQLMKEGRLHGSAQSTEGGFTISGSIDFSATVINQLSGSCEATLDALRSCYEDESKCPGATADEQTQQHQSVTDYLAPYLDHGVLEPGEISRLEALGWQATYH